MNPTQQQIADKLASVKAAHRKRRKRPWFRQSIGALKGWLHSHRQHERHHPCEARRTASKNTHGNPWNIRSTKALRPEGRFMKLRAFKHRYGLI